MKCDGINRENGSTLTYTQTYSVNREMRWRHCDNRYQFGFVRLVLSHFLFEFYFVQYCEWDEAQSTEHRTSNTEHSTYYIYPRLPYTLSHRLIWCGYMSHVKRFQVRTQHCNAISRDLNHKLRPSFWYLLFLFVSLASASPSTRWDILWCLYPFLSSPPPLKSAHSIHFSAVRQSLQFIFAFVLFLWCTHKQQQQRPCVSASNTSLAFSRHFYGLWNMIKWWYAVLINQINSDTCGKHYTQLHWIVCFMHSCIVLQSFAFILCECKCHVF